MSPPYAPEPSVPPRLIKDSETPVWLGLSKTIKMALKFAKYFQKYGLILSHREPLSQKDILMVLLS